MSPSHTSKGSRRYRYYVSQAGDRADGSAPITRVNAAEIEAVVVRQLRTALPAQDGIDDAALIAQSLDRVCVQAKGLAITLVGVDAPPLTIAWTAQTQVRRRDVIMPPGTIDRAIRPMKAEDRIRILKAIARARTWTAALMKGELSDSHAIAVREACSERSVRLTLSLAQLSPQIVQAIVAGRLPRGIGIRHLAELPASWHAQHRTLGF